MVSIKQKYIIKYSLIMAAFILVFFLPERLMFESDSSLCIHKRILNFECPLCGLTRSAHELLHFRFSSIFAYNFNIIFLPFYIFFDLAWLKSGRAFFLKARKVTVYLFVGGILLLYLFRIANYLQLF